MQESREEGRAEGERAKSLETAAKMKLRGYSVDVICDITGLTPDEVGKL
jgi:predicted transposase/invertase (TIGR01784 family)